MHVPHVLYTLSDLLRGKYDMFSTKSENEHLYKNTYFLYLAIRSTSIYWKRMSPDCN